MTESNPENRRNRRRFGVKGCTVRYRRAGLGGFFSEYSTRLLVLDISDAGLHFITKDEPRMGQIWALQIEAPGTNEPIQARARAVWVRKSTDHHAFHVGLRFDGVDKDDQPRLKALLDNALLDKIDMGTKMYLKEIERL